MPCHAIPIYRPQLMFSFPPSLALSDLIAKSWGRGSHPSAHMQLSVPMALMCCYYPSNVNAMKGSGKASCTRLVGHTTCRFTYNHSCITSITAIREFKDFVGQLSASDPLLHSSWFHVTDKAIIPSCIFCCCFGPFWFVFHARSICFKRAHGCMVGGIKQQCRKRSPVGKSDYTLLGGFSCWELACIFPPCIWRSYALSYAASYNKIERSMMKSLSHRRAHLFSKSSRDPFLCFLSCLLLACF